jgi:hypothetical protein
MEVENMALQFERQHLLDFVFGDAVVNGHRYEPRRVPAWLWLGVSGYESPGLGIFGRDGTRGRLRLRRCRLSRSFFRWHNRG